MEWFAGFLASIIRPIIRDEIDNLKAFISRQYARSEVMRKFDDEAEELLSQIESATTTEEVWANVERLKKSRARLGI